MKQFDGIFTALLTPFDGAGKIAEEKLARLVKHNLKLGVRGFYVGGSTAEAFLLSTDERRQIMDVVAETAPQATLIAHIGSLNEREATALARHAADRGYDAISSVAPYYYKFSAEEIRGYYFRLAESTPLPMLVYHFPAFSGVNMGVGEMSKFLDHERFLGIKYTSNDFFMMEQCKTKYPGKIVYNGYDEMFLAGLSMGADGGIGSTYNFMADKFVRIRALYEAGKMQDAKAVQQEANRIITTLCQIGVMQAEKEVLNQLGMDFGICRHPFGEPTSEQKALIAREIIPYITAL